MSGSRFTVQGFNLETWTIVHAKSLLNRLMKNPHLTVNCSANNHWTPLTRYNRGGQAWTWNFEPVYLLIYSINVLSSRRFFYQKILNIDQRIFPLFIIVLTNMPANFWSSASLNKIHYYYLTQILLIHLNDSSSYT